MTMHHLRHIWLHACVIAWAAWNANAGERFTPYDVAKIRSVSQAAISPSGDRVAYLLSVPAQVADGEKDGTAWSELHIVDREGRSRAFVTGKEKVGSLDWTPDGSGISFLAKRAGDDHRSLYVIPADGGEARRVIERQTDISAYSWSPDGKRAAILATEEEDKKARELKEKGFNQEIYEEDVPLTRVWIAKAVDSGETAEDARLLELEGSASELSWSPRGDQLAVALAPTALVDDSYMRRIVHIVDVETGKATAKLEHPAKLGAVAWRPDGEQLAVIAGEDINDPREGRLFLWNTEGKKIREMLPDYAGHVASAAWKDSKTLVYLGLEGVWTVVGEIDADGSNRRVRVDKGGPILSGLDLSKDGRAMAFVGDTPRHPNEVYYLEEGRDQPERLSHCNPWLEEMSLAEQEPVSFEARDGLEIEGILIHPLERESGARSPLILYVHGGPESHVSNGWLTSYAAPGQVAAGEGFAVFYPNYRGSTGRGVEFSKLGQADAAGKEFMDLVDAVDHFVKTGLADRDRVAITGGSYGGYASAWGATYYSDRFAAAVMFVGISDNLSKVGTTDIPFEMRSVHHRKWLWEDWDYFLKRSPIYYVEQARTPLLILHGKADPRVHPSQSMELYRHVKTLGKTPVRLVFYPGEGHGNRRAASRLDYNLRMLRWMKHFVQEGAEELPPRELDYRLGDDKGSDESKGVDETDES